MAGKRTVAPTGKKRKRASLAESAAALEALGVDAVSVLEWAAWAEAQALGLAPDKAVAVDARLLFAPSVADAIVCAALVCQDPPVEMRWQRLSPSDEKLLLTALEIKAEKDAQALLLRVSAALRSPNDPNLDAAELEVRSTEALVLARAVQAEAERLAKRFERLRTSDGKPRSAAIAQARQHVAEERGMSVGALQLKIRRAFEASPGVAWPEIMPRPSKNRHA